MAQEALYRKARPMTFDEMRGQEVVVRSLKNQIMRDRVSHAYLFTGIRGTGKTSAARIFARAINCENPKDGNPCNCCETCRQIISGSSDNVIEIDAAAHGLIDDIRQIGELAGHRPMYGKYRVFIIDEIQEMKAGASNAFLKTLEEPPSWVIFILATTSLKNIPDTIMSRCQHYTFRRLDYETAADQMRRILKKEGLDADDDALLLLAGLSQGSMRDALSLLDRAEAYAAGERLTVRVVNEALGIRDLTAMSGLLNALLTEDAGGGIRIFREMTGEGTDPEGFMNGFLTYLRDVLLVQDGYDAGSGRGNDYEAAVKRDAARIGHGELTELIRHFSEAQIKIQFGEMKTVAAEMAIAAACSTKKREAGLIARLAELEEKAEQLLPQESTGGMI